MIIGGLIKQSLIDYPGKISAVVFTRGCNFRCGYCHNPELVLPNLFHRQKTIQTGDFFNWLKSRKNWLDAVVVTGGEPTIHCDLPEFLHLIKSLGYKVKLDTNGTNPDLLKFILSQNLVDYVAMDIKTVPDITSYSQITGIMMSNIDIEKVEQSLIILKKALIQVEFRTTVIPDIHTPVILEKINCLLGPGFTLTVQSFRDGDTIEKLKCN